MAESKLTTIMRIPKLSRSVEEGIDAYSILENEGSEKRNNH